MNTEDKMKAMLRRHRLAKIIDDHFARDNDAVVDAIKEQTRQEVSVRSIQTWLIDPSRKSHRSLPEWALQALEQYVMRDDKQEHLARVRQRMETRRARPHQFDYFDVVRARHAVDFAEHEVESEANERKRWCEVFGKVGGAAIAERFRAMERENRLMSSELAAIGRALLYCETYEDFRRYANDSMRDERLTKSIVRETRELYESNGGEFERSDGLPPASS